MVWTKDDTADKKTAEFLKSVPAAIRKHIERAEIGPKGLTIHLRADTPPAIAREIREKIKGA